MKTLILLALFWVAASRIISAQAVFSVKPGINLQGASIGFQADKLQPFAGMRFASAGLKTEYTDENFPEDDYTSKTRINVYMPFIGSKLYLGSSAEVKPYLMAAIYKPLVFGKQTIDGEENDDFKETLNNIGIWAGELAFGTEYYFHPSFSVGGEFGLRLANIKSRFETDDGSVTDITRLGFGVSFVTFSLNYHLSKASE